jgi:hypothetical protein
MNCLNNTDETLVRITLRLLTAMVTENNLTLIVDIFLKKLESTTDKFLKCMRDVCVTFSLFYYLCFDR